MNRLVRTALLLSLLLVPPCHYAAAAEWPHWRGPSYNGSSPEANLPVKWSTTDNVRWTAELPGPSAATPIIWGDYVFVSSTDAENNQLKALCFRRTDGKLLWQHVVETGATRKDRRSTFAAPSPTTDGKRVVFFYSDGTLVAYTMDGTQMWQRNIQKDYGPFAFMWTFSSSPLLYAGKLYLQVLQRDVPVGGRGLPDQENLSYLLAMDPQTGKTLYRHIRPSKAVAESHESFASPVPYQYRNRKEILVAGGDAITGHDPENGAELWRWGTWNPTRIPHWRLVVSPVAGAGIILACAPKRAPIYAIKAGGHGVLTDAALAWVSRKERAVSADVPTPAFYDGDFFVLSDVRRSLSRVEPKTGKIKWSITTPGRDKYEASPTAADGKIYLINFAGQVTVVDAASGKILNKIAMMAKREENPVRSTIAVAHGNLFIRTNDKLYCIGGSSQ